MAGDEDAIRWYGSYFVRGASPGAAMALRAMNEDIDVRSVLPTIHVPTLVLYRAREYLREATRYMGRRIPDARVVELPGADHVPWEGDQDSVLAEIERFLAGAAAGREADRVLTTVLCLTVPAGGDADRVHAHLPRFRGTALEDGGDAVLAAFDGPARAIRCATSLVGGRDLRAGVHTGECETSGDGLRGTPLELARALAGHARPARSSSPRPSATSSRAPAWPSPNAAPSRCRPAARRATGRCSRSAAEAATAELPGPYRRPTATRLGVRP